MHRYYLFYATYLYDKPLAYCAQVKYFIPNDNKEKI